MVAALEANHPWRLDSVGARRRYVAWHIRTTEGESARSYNPEHHKYLFSGPSPHVCGAFLSATEKAEDMCQLSSANHEAHQGLSPVYISSNRCGASTACWRGVNQALVFAIYRKPSTAYPGNKRNARCI